MVESPIPPENYPELLAALKARIRDARLRTAVGVNRELILLYWEIGHDILLRQSAEGWGTGVIDRQSCNSSLHNCLGVITSDSSGCLSSHRNGKPVRAART